MKKSKWFKLSYSMIVVLGLMLVQHYGDRFFAAGPGTHLSGSSSSGPIAVTPDNESVWVANPDNNSVSLINVENDANQKVDEIQVGREPQNLAVSPDGKFVYVSRVSPFP